MPLVAKWEVEVIGEFAVNNGEEDGVFGRRFAARVFTFAKNEAEGVGCLMPCPSSFRFVGFCGVHVEEAREFERMSQVGGCEAVAEEFGEGTAAGGRVVGRGEVVMNVGFACWEEEEEPVLFDAGSGFGRIASELGEGGVGLERAKGGMCWGRR